MAVTKIWTINTHLNASLDYVKNEKKTKSVVKIPSISELQDLDERPGEDLSDGIVITDLDNALSYVSQDYKTDTRHYVSGINCSDTDALVDFQAVKKIYGNWCVIFASWCGYQCGYSDTDGQLGVVPRNNDTTSIYNWYRNHPEAGTAYYCYRGAMSPDDIPIQPGSFIIWENNGNTIHQEHLSMITSYDPSSHVFDTIDGNSWSSYPEPASGYYYVCEHRNRSWSNNIYAVIVPAYPEENTELEYSPLEQAIEDGRYPDNYDEIDAVLESVNIESCIIQNTLDYSVGEAYNSLEWYMNQGVNPISFTEPTYHSSNIIYPYEQDGYTGMQWIINETPTMAHLRFYSNIDLPDWYFSDGYYSHYRDCSECISYRSDVLS